VITINLLPPEYRKPESTPVGRFLAIVVGAVLVTSGLGVYGYVHYSKLRAAREVREATEANYKNKKAQQDMSRALAEEIKAYEARRATIQEVAGSRILWSRKLDEFLDILHNGGDKNEYFVWLSGMKVSPARDSGRGKPTSGGEMSFAGYCAGTELTKVTNLRNKIRKDEFYKDFKYLSPPNWQVERFNDGREPAAAGKFNFQLTLKPLDWRRAAKQGR
jgi:hypothetical protein